MNSNFNFLQSARKFGSNSGSCSTPRCWPARHGTDADDAAAHGAVALFVDAARAADHRFALDQDNVAIVIDVCRQLDGLALALKLAAARVPFLGLHGLQARLAERLKVVAGGQRNAPTRLQTLRAALDWSYRLLSAGEQATFRRLSVFVGGFTLPFAAAIATDDGNEEFAAVEHLAALVDRSLVVAGDEDPPRYRLLESAREYGLERLVDAEEATAFRQRHAHIVAEWMAREERAYWTRPDTEWMPRFAPSSTPCARRPIGARRTTRRER